MRIAGETNPSIVEVAESNGRWTYTDLNFATQEGPSSPDRTPWRQVAPLPSARSGLAAVAGDGDGRHVYYQDLTGSVTALTPPAAALTDQAESRVFTADVDAPVAAGVSALATTAGRGLQVYYLDREHRPVALAESAAGAWEYLPCTQGPPASAVGRLAATSSGRDRQIYYLDTQGHLIEAAWVNNGGELWSVTDLTAELPAPVPAVVSPLTAVHGGADLRRVYYLDAESRLVELAYSIRPPDKRNPEGSAGWEVTNLSAWAGAPTAAAAGPMAAALVGGSRPHVYYRAGGGGLIDMAWRGAGWEPSSPTESANRGAGAPVAAATSALAVTLPESTESSHLFYVDPRQRLIHLYRSGREWWSADLSTEAGLPEVARSSPLAAICSSGPRVYYLSEE